LSFVRAIWPEFRTWIRVRCWVGAVLSCSIAVAAVAQPEYADTGAKSCLDCHASPQVMGIAKTAHANRSDPKTPASQKACESCHGGSAAHMRFPMQLENLHFGKKSKTEAKVQNQVCLDCHSKGAEDWEASAHGFENVVCSTCHAIHDPARIVPAKATASNGCSVAGCHVTLMDGASPDTFSHAVGRNIGNKGEVTCAGCHDPHGPLRSERCGDCHPQTPEVLALESDKARRFHDVAAERETECIRCHKALSHPIKPLAIEQREQQGGASGQSEAGG
jgi:nitrate/TMAO reductase-like tetraheme cytochrome c subunit